MQVLAKARKEKKSFLTHRMDRDETVRFWKYFFLHHPIPKARQKQVLQSPGFAASGALSEHTFLIVTRYSGIPLSEEENRIVARFGKAFRTDLYALSGFGESRSTSQRGTN